MSDLVKRLRERRMTWVGAGIDADPDCSEAADRIEVLEAEVARLTEAKGAPAAVYWQNKAKEAEARLTTMTAKTGRLEAALRRASDAFSGIADHILERKGAPETIIWRGVFADCQREGISVRKLLAKQAALEAAQ